MNRNVAILALSIAFFMVLAIQMFPSDILSAPEDNGHGDGAKRVYERYANNTAAQTWADQDDQMVLIQPDDALFPSFYIDSFEATISKRRAWSVAGLTPTTRLLFKEAEEACKNAGKRLCNVEEWRTACRGGITKPIVFPDTAYIRQNCDMSRSKGYDKTDYPGVNNTHPNCTPPGISLYHMIGNLSEFVYGPNNEIMVVGVTYYDAVFKQQDLLARHACERTVAEPGKYPANRHNEGMGFRCCVSTN